LRAAEFDVIAGGLLCLDMIPRFATEAQSLRMGELLRPGTLVLMGGMVLSTGGAVSNVGIAMKIFGLRVGFAAKVGDDPLGRAIVSQLEQSGNAAGIKVARGEASSYTVVLAPPGIDRIFLHCPGTNDTFSWRDIDYRLLAGSRLFHFGYPTLMRSMYAGGGGELALLLQKAKRAGVTTSLDISLPDPSSPAGRVDWREIYGRVLPHTDIFLPSIEEAFYTLHPEEYLKRKQACGGKELIDNFTPEEYRGLGEELLSLGCRMAALKAGHNGWYIRTAGREELEGLGRAAPSSLEAWGDRELWCPAFASEKIASTTGAGDSSIAGFLTAFLRGRCLEECLKLANCAGYLNLRALDALSGLASWEEMERILPGLKVRENAFLAASGWRWRSDFKLWEK